MGSGSVVEEVDLITFDLRTKVGTRLRRSNGVSSISPGRLFLYFSQ